MQQNIIRIYDRMTHSLEAQTVSQKKYNRLIFLLITFNISLFTLPACALCPQCGNQMSSTKDGLVCQHCGYSSKAVSCDHTSACNCATASSTSAEDQSRQLLELYGAFLTSTQRYELELTLATGQPHKPLLMEWGIIQPEFPVVTNMPSSYTSTGEEGSACPQASVSLSPGSFLLANGGLQQSLANLEGSDTDWYENLSALIVNLMHQGFIPEESMLNSVCRLLQQDQFQLSAAPLPALVCSGTPLRITIAVMNEFMVYFHGLSVSGGSLLYFIPNSGVYSINADLLNRLLEKLRDNASIFVFIKSRQASEPDQNEPLTRP